MKFIFMLLLINASFNVLSNGFENSIEQCLIKANKYIDENRLAEIDTAYIMPHDELVEISFSKGFYGGFQKRDTHFNTVFYCILDNDQNVKLLSEGLRRVFINDLPELFVFNNETQTKMELLFIKDEGKFVFFKSQEYNKENFMRHNPDFYNE